MAEEIGGLAVAEPIEAGTGTETVDTSIESGAEGEISSESSNQDGTQDDKSQLTQQPAAKGKLNLTDVVKKSADALKAINPQLPDAMRKAAFELGGLYREFPGGLKEAVQAKQVLSEYGGAEGLKESKETLDGMSALAKSFFDGKEDFVNSLIEESSSAFSQMMPVGLSKWKATDPEMYNHVQSRVFTQTLDGIGIRQALSSAYNALDATSGAAARAELERVWNTLDEFKAKGEKAPERKVTPQDEALTKREQELAARETKALLSPIKNEGMRQIESITQREMMASYQWDKTDQDVQSAVQERVRQEVIKASGKDQGFVREFDRLKDRGDSAGLSRHVKNFQDRVTPGIVQRVAKLFAVRPKNAGPVAVIKKGPESAAPVKAEQGWTRINGQPSAAQMDRSKTTADLILDNKAILKDGRKVQWA